jgi:hypothetical protein
MNENEIFARFGLVPRAEDLPEIRALVQSVTADEDRASDEPLKALCILLFSAGEPSDSLLIYKAKMSSMDAGCWIDIQLTCGAGIERTKAFLLNSREPVARELLDDLQACISAGDFEDFTPAGHLEIHRRYYGISP